MSKEILGFEIVIENARDVVYVAYQGDVNEFQTVYVSEEPRDAEQELIETHVLSTFRACLAGWWATKENAVVAELARHKGEFVAPVHGFVVRVTELGWEAYDIEYTSEKLHEAVITKIEEGVSDPPIPVPTFYLKSPPPA